LILEYQGEMSRLGVVPWGRRFKKKGFFAVLQQGVVDSPGKAVRAAVVSVSPKPRG
jgi:hypothetical protein